MKRMALIAVLLLILTLLPAALADTQPSVSFTTNQITAQCGNTVTLTLAANAAPSRDITINITDERGDLGSIVLGALFMHDGDARVRKIGKLLRRFRTTQIGAHYA